MRGTRLSIARSIASRMLASGVLLAMAWPAAAELQNLPVPLTLPPSLIETLPLNKDLSYVGDAVRIVDCPKESQNPYGSCDNWLFGGLAMWDTHISGVVQIQFYKPINSIAHFEISHPLNLSGDDTVMQAPQGYDVRVKNTFVLDALDQISSGDLNLLTGEVTNNHMYLLFSNSWYGDLTTVNPRLVAPDFQFPGIYGSAQWIFTQRADGNLDLTIQSSTFLPLNNVIQSEPVQMPTPYCGTSSDCVGIQAPGTSLHPHLYYSTTDTPAPPPCNPACPTSLPSNTVETYEAQTYFTSFGDHFTVVVPELGGPGSGRTHLQGRIHVQFGPKVGNYVPVHMSAFPQLGFIAPIPVAPPPLTIFPIKMFGHDEYLHFPLLTYATQQSVALEDPFDISVGSIDVRSGQSVAQLLSRLIPGQTLFNVIIGLNITRIPLDSFRFRGPLYFAQGTNGESILGFNGGYFATFDTYLFPSPDYSKPNQAVAAGYGSELNPFWRYQATKTFDQPKVNKSNSGSYVSSFNQPFNFSYSVSCDPSAGTGTLEYTNSSFTSSNGTFHMENLSSVTCTNSKNSVKGVGDYDTVTVVGYGTWSRDITNGRHVVTLHEMTAPDLPYYVSIQIDGGIIAQTHLKPSYDPIP